MHPTPRRKPLLGRLTATYVVGLVLLAVLSGVSFVSMSLSISSGTGYAALVNHSGRQRMLLKHTALLVLMMSQAQVNGERRQLAAELATATGGLERSATGLLKGDQQLGLPTDRSPAVQALLTAAPDDLHARMMAYARLLREIGAHPLQLRADDRRVRQVLEAHRALLPIQERLVAQYQRESEYQATRLQLIAGAASVATLLLLALVGLLLFRPMVRRIYEVDRLKSEFISVVSHELRTPLTSIRGAFGLLEGGVAGELPEQAHKLAQLGRNNSERLARLIDALLDLGKIEAGKVALRREVVAVDELIVATVASLDDAASEAGIRLEVPTTQSTSVWGDKERLQQVLVNLVSNAIKFSPPDSTVCIRVTSAGTGKLKIAVHDEGPGVPRDEQHRLFDCFEQLDVSDARAKHGVGLGLAICKEIVELHAGELGLESTGQRGSEFFFVLERASEQAPPAV